MLIPDRTTGTVDCPGATPYFPWLLIPFHIA